jgi:hypothetical protein
VSSVNSPIRRPLHVLRNVFRSDECGTVRLVEDRAGLTYVEVDLHAADQLLLVELLGLLDDIGWRPVPEELDCASLTVDGLASRIQVRHFTELSIDEY